MMTKKGIFYFLYFFYIKIALAQEQQKEFEISSEQNIPKTFEILQSLQKTDTNFLATDFGTTAIPIYTEYTRRSVIPTASSYFYYTVTGTFPYSTYPYSKPIDFYETRSRQEYSTGFYPFTSSASERFLINETTGSAENKDDVKFNSNYLLPPPPPPLPPNPLPSNIKEILAISLRFSSKEPIIDVVGELTTVDPSTDSPKILQTTKNTFSSTSQVQTFDDATQKIPEVSTTPMPILQKIELIGTYIPANSTKKVPNLDKNLIRSEIEAVLPKNYELTFIQISEKNPKIVNFGMTAILSDEYQSQMPIKILLEIQENQAKIETIQNIEFLGKIIEIREPEIPIEITITEISRDQAKNKNDSGQNSVIENIDYDVDWVTGILEDNYLFAMIIAICVLFVVILFLSYFVYQKATKTGSVRFR